MSKISVSVEYLSECYPVASCMSEISFTSPALTLFFVSCRCFFLSKIEEKLSLLPDSEGASEDGAEMDAQSQEEDARALITSCSFSMRMQMAESARKQVGARATDSEPAVSKSSFS